MFNNMQEHKVPDALPFVRALCTRHRTYHNPRKKTQKSNEAST